MKLRNGLLWLVLGLLACGQFCRADLTIQPWFDLPLHGGQANVKIDGNTQVVHAGQLKVTVDGTTESWVSYCTDLGATLASGPFLRMSLQTAQALTSWQTPGWAPEGLTRATQYYTAFRDLVNSPQDAVALQVVIWESLYDEAPSLTQGRFQLLIPNTQFGAYAQAENWLSSPLPALTGNEVWWGPTQNGSYRVSQGILGDIVSVPEPSSSMLFLSGIVTCLIGTLVVKSKPFAHEKKKT